MTILPSWQRHNLFLWRQHNLCKWSMEYGFECTITVIKCSLFALHSEHNIGWAVSITLLGLRK